MHEAEISAAVQEAGGLNIPAGNVAWGRRRMAQLIILEDGLHFLAALAPLLQSGDASAIVHRHDIGHLHLDGQVADIWKRPSGAEFG